MKLFPQFFAFLFFISILFKLNNIVNGVKVKDLFELIKEFERRML